MIYCDDFQIKKWIAPPQEDFPRPEWTKLITNGKVLSNSIEFAEWYSDPIEPIVCESCWYSGCAIDDFYKVYRLKSQLLWVRYDTNDDLNAGLTQPERTMAGEMAIFPNSVWKRFQDMFDNVAPVEFYPPMTRGVLSDLWLRNRPVNLLKPNFPLLSNQAWPSVCASDRMGALEAGAILNSIREWLRSAPDEVVEGTILKPEEIGCEIATLYFSNDLTYDNYVNRQWPAFYDGCNWALPLEKGWAFQPETPVC